MTKNAPPPAKTKQNEMNKQTNKQNSKTKHGICFVLFNNSWSLGLPGSMVDRPSDTPLEKTDFSLL